MSDSSWLRRGDGFTSGGKSSKQKLTGNEGESVGHQNPNPMLSWHRKDFLLNFDCPSGLSCCSPKDAIINSASSEEDNLKANSNENQARIKIKKKKTQLSQNIRNNKRKRVSSSSDQADKHKSNFGDYILSNDKKGKNCLKSVPLIEADITPFPPSPKCSKDLVKSCNPKNNNDNREKFTTKITTYRYIPTTSSKPACEIQTNDNKLKDKWAESTFDDLPLNFNEKFTASSKKIKYTGTRIMKDSFHENNRPNGEACIADCPSSPESSFPYVKHTKEGISDVEDIVSSSSDESDNVTNSFLKKSIQNTDDLPGTCNLSLEIGSQQAEICEISSTGSGSELASQKVGASDWAVRFQQEIGQISPESNKALGGDNSAVPNQLDSAKKKYKFSSTSLVGQLSRVIKREKSAARFWQHSLTKGSNAENQPRSVLLSVVSLRHHGSLYVCNCEVKEDNESLLQCNKCEVWFTKADRDHLDIGKEALIRIYPPWKQMDLGNKITIVCAYQAKAETNHKEKNLCGVSALPTSSNQVSNPSNAETERAEFTLRWMCPCLTDQMIQCDRCPAYYSDHFHKFSQISLSLPQSLPNPSVHLHCVQSASLLDKSPGNLLSRLSATHRAHHSGSLCSPTNSSLLHSVQEERAGRECMPPFFASVLRVFRKMAVTGKNVCISVLLEDDQGSLAMVNFDQISLESHHSLWSELLKMEGKRCSCQGVSMVNRFTKDRAPELFQVVSGVWKGFELKNHEDESQEGSKSKFPRKAPGFCYELRPVIEAHRCIHLVKSADSEFADSSPAKSSIHVSPLRLCPEAKRFSCVVHLVNVSEGLHKTVHPNELFALNACDAEEVVFHRVHLSEMFVMTKQLLSDRKLHTCFLQDVFWNTSFIQADEYSTLFWPHEWDNLSFAQDAKFQASDCIKIFPALDQAKSTDLFVKVSGQIVHIEAEKCYCWQECENCSNELTEEQLNANETLKCLFCEKEVSNANTRVHMEVDILEDTYKDCCVSIDLTEEAITSLLPVNDTDEGHDMSAVLGKRITGFAFVCSRNSNLVQLYQLAA